MGKLGPNQWANLDLISGQTFQHSLITQLGWGSSAGLTEKTGTILMWVRVPGEARDFFSQSQLPCRLSHGAYTAPCVQSHASTSVHTLKIPNTGSHTIVWTQETRHTLAGVGSTALAAAVPYPGKVPQNSHEGQGNTIKKERKKKKKRERSPNPKAHTCAAYYLNVDEPLLQTLHPTLPFNDAPHDQVQRARRQEVLVCCVVFTLKGTAKDIATDRKFWYAA